MGGKSKGDFDTSVSAYAKQAEGAGPKRDILEDLTVAQVFRFATVPLLLNRVGHQMTGASRSDPNARARGQLCSTVWVANLDGNAVAVKRLRGWDDPNLTQEDRARALMGVLINHPSSFVNYFGYCIVEVEESTDPEAPPVVHLVQDEDVEFSALSSAMPGLDVRGATTAQRDEPVSKPSSSTYARSVASGGSSPRRFKDTFGKLMGKANKHSLGWATSGSKKNKVDVTSITSK